MPVQLLSFLAKIRAVVNSTYRIPLYCILQIRSPCRPVPVSSKHNPLVPHARTPLGPSIHSQRGHFVTGQFCTSMCGTIFCFGMQLQICIAYHFLICFPYALPFRPQGYKIKGQQLASLLTSSSKAPTSAEWTLGGHRWACEYTAASSILALQNVVFRKQNHVLSTSIPSENGVLSTSIVVLSCFLHAFVGDHTHDVSAVYVLLGELHEQYAVNWVVPKQWWCDAGLQSLQWEGGDPMASWNHIHDFWPRPSQPQWWSHCSCGHVHASWL